MTTLNTLKKSFLDTLNQCFPNSEKVFNTSDIEITSATHSEFGHYQCNSAMKLAKLLKEPPQKIALKLVDNIHHYTDIIQSAVVAGPGFINIELKLDYLAQKLAEKLGDHRLGIPSTESKEKVIVDFSSPNTAKEMHVGHLRSTIIGDCLARVFEFLGHDVLRLNHVGDWGTQFGMLIAFIKEDHPGLLNAPVEQFSLSELAQWYKASKARFDHNPTFKEQAQQEVVLLQSGNKNSLATWEKICAISRHGYQAIYDLLDIQIEERGESFYNPLLPSILDSLANQQLLLTSDGAKCVFIEGYENREGTPLPLLIQKKDGGFNYATTDLAALKHRAEKEKANKILYVVDKGQALHFDMVFKTAALAQFYDPHKTEPKHIPFGLVLREDGKKFKTREGDTEKLVDLIDNAVKKSEKILLTRSPGLDEKTLHDMAKVLGINAIKYADLSCHRTHDYHFSYDRMLQFEGNTAAFIMYAYVRIQGIKRKANKNMEMLTNSPTILIQESHEIALALQLIQLEDTLAHIAIEYLPHRLTDYLYKLAEKFHAFFHHCRVEGHVQENARLLLCELTARTLKLGMHLLGLQCLEKM